MHPYRALEPSLETATPPKSKLPWVLLVAGAMHVGVLGAAAFAQPAPVAQATHGPTITVLGGHVDETTGDIALSGYHVVERPQR
jgi:hypothetical protein